MTEQPQKLQSDSSGPSAVPPELEGKTLIPSEAVAEDTGDEVRARQVVRENSRTRLATANSFAVEIHTYVRQNIAWADQKAAFLFAAVTAVLAYLHKDGATRRWLVDPSRWQIPDALACLAVLGLVGGAICALLAVAPRFRGSPQGMIYWKAIASFGRAKDYADRVVASEASALTRAKLEHCYELAQICRRKYRAVNIAIWSGSLGLGAAVAYLAFS